MIERLFHFLHTVLWCRACSGCGRALRGFLRAVGLRFSERNFSAAYLRTQLSGFSYLRNRLPAIAFPGLSELCSPDFRATWGMHFLRVGLSGWAHRLGDCDVPQPGDWMLCRFRIGTHFPDDGGNDCLRTNRKRFPILSSLHSLKRGWWLPVVAACAGACSDPEPQPLPVADEPTDVLITSLQYECEKVGIEQTYSLDGMDWVLAFNPTDPCNLLEETDATFQMMTYNRLYFTGEGTDADGTLHIAKNSVRVFRSPPWDPDNYSTPYKYYLLMPVGASEAGEFVFTIRFFQPQTGASFLSRPYRLKIEAGADRRISKIEIGLV